MMAVLEQLYGFGIVPAKVLYKPRPGMEPQPPPVESSKDLRFNANEAEIHVMILSIPVSNCCTHCVFVRNRRKCMVASSGPKLR